MSMTSSDRPSTIDIGHYWRVIRRMWWVVLLGGILGGAAAVVYLAMTPPVAEATTQVNVTVITTDPFNSDRAASGLIDAETESQLTRSSRVAQEVADVLGDVTPAEVRAATSSTVLADATVIRISFAGPDPATARRGADAVAASYIDYRSDLAENRRTQILDVLSARRDTLRAELSAVNLRFAGAAPGSPELADAEADRALLTIELNSLLGQVTSLEALGTAGGFVLTAADDTEITITPGVTLTLMTGALVGVVGGLMVAFALNRRHGRLLDDSDLLGMGAVTILTHVPGRKARVPADDDDLDAIRVARERVLAGLDAPHAVVAVIDYTGGAGCSDVGFNLALSLAEGGRHVRVVLPSWPADALASIQNLVVGHAGGDLDGAELLADTRVRLSTGTPSSEAEPSRHDIALVVTPPRASRSERLTAARSADLVVVLVALSHTRADDIQQGLDEMFSVGTHSFGAIIVRNERSSQPPAAVVHWVREVGQIDKSAPAAAASNVGEDEGTTGNSNEHSDEGTTGNTDEHSDEGTTGNTDQGSDIGLDSSEPALTRANRLVTTFEPAEDGAGGVGEVGFEGEALAVDLDGC